MPKKTTRAHRNRDKKKVAEFLKRMETMYPDAHCSLDYRTPYELLTATILSAQCTDERVNKVTPAFFEKWPTVKDLAKASPTDVEQAILTTGFYHNKAKSLLGMAQYVVEHYDSVIPDSMEKLTKLPGVGRKTANVLLGNCFQIPGITVDTHVTRLSRRFGLSGGATAEAIEQDLMAVIPQSEWTIFSHRMIAHGRARCTARKTLCDGCLLSDMCNKDERVK